MFEVSSNSTILRVMHAINLLAAGATGAFMLFAPDSMWFATFWRKWPFR